MDSAFRIIILVQSEFKSLDYKESLWIKRLNGIINLVNFVKLLTFDCIYFNQFLLKTVFL